jgi:HD-GYP domain-containing protein (c-di-GMP phosphodiesterase class II)
VRVGPCLPGRGADGAWHDPDPGGAALHELGGFSATVHQLVGRHHERLDGTGYPEGAGSDQLSLDVRILAVCDVYDALISARVYRAAWPHERAIALLREGSGTTFDARCVEALEQVLARERGADLAVAV